MIHGRDIQEGLLADAAQSSPPIDIRFTVDNPDIIHRVQEFHRSFATLQNILCNVCLERFPTITTNTIPTEICHRCNIDKETPKLFSVENNMDPGPVPHELSVSSINVVKAHFHLMVLNTVFASAALPQK